MIKKVISTLALFLFLCPAYTQVKYEFGKLNERLDTYEANKDFNGVILIAEKGKIIFSRSVGYADFENDIKLNLNTPMHLASNTKVFTNMAIMILAERELLNFDDKVEKHIQEFPYKDITIRHLMTMTSGLKRLYTKDLNRDGFITNTELLTYLSHKKPKLSFTPGNQVQSNVVGFCILAEVISRVSRKDYIQFMQEEIFLPLEMNETFIVNKTNLDKFRAISYNSKNQIKEWFLGSFVGGVSIYASANDMLKWDYALRNKVLISNETTTKAYEKFQYNNGKYSSISLGSWKRWKGKDNLIFKNGDWVANNSIFWQDFENELTIIIMNNRQNKITKYDLMDMILPSLGYNLGKS